MIDTTDLTSYYPGYDEYCESKKHEKSDLWDLADIYHDEEIIKKEIEKMERNIIYLKNTSMSFEEIMNLEDYVWENDKLIPIEQLEGE